MALPGAAEGGDFGGGAGANLLIRVRTHWPCSNCTRAHSPTSSVPVGTATNVISRLPQGPKVPSFQTSTGVVSDGSGDTRTNFAADGGSVTRRTTWWALALVQ